MSVLSDSGPAGPAPVDAVASPPRQGAVRRLLRSPVAVVALVWVLLVALLAALAPLLTSASPTASQITNALAPMGGANLLGTDGIGRDVLAQLLYGARTSIVGGVIVVVVSLALGLPAGIVAGYYRGRFDAVASWIANLLMALPAIIVLLVVLAQFGRSTELGMAVFGVIIAPGVFRLVRASVLAVREELFVDAARVSGLSDGRIMRRHVLPVVIAPTVIQASQLLGIAIVIQAGLEFLGLGSPNQASWGGMLSDAFQNIYAEPRLLLFPGLAIVLTVTAFSLLGNALRDALGVGGRMPRVRRRATVVAAPDSDVPAPVVSEPPGDALLAVQDLRVSYPKGDGSVSEVVRGVSLALRRGEVLGLVGESGSGKSQTAFAVLGLLPPTARTSAERLTFDGTDLQRLSPAERNRLRGRRIGYIPQEPMSNLVPSFRIGSQLTEPMRHHLGLSRAEARRRALDLLARVGIQDPGRVFDSYPHEISGGMAQRVLIAGAVSCDPELLIADEPTTALDVTVQAEVLDLLRSLVAERDLGVVLVTHDFGVVADLCDTVAVMQEGRIVEEAPAGRLFDAPEHEYTRMLLSSTLENSPSRQDLPPAVPDPDEPEPLPLSSSGGPR
ncbi:dipeptide/oligopeptide/nickel ABC transporter permease/ATP-binding protein [Blastococcus tunisiensis]|uniref:Peptide/nickel transport system permease protein n=1 Tax=Blastococcus tunisiensis TaxID=1798228 RepID=A0A1I2MCU8_9ACTN|nr:dipeptide/oligopeptide/nickel ABC transporter permease/ATP-binding protein [Blastococcus sp. DSM 46838]SFF87216.1 peptide/nickel transport system permease protein [Blastococcus sp. DSM 46838]